MFKKLTEKIITSDERVILISSLYVIS